jgi:enamine deaminase RidA (YjgF/YER057c/UK114 family)
MGTPNYTHAMLTEGATRWLHIAGQVGVLADGSTAEGIDAQCDAVFANIGKLLEGAEMTADNICHLRIYMLDRAHIPSLRRARSALLGDRVVPSTLVLVSGLVDPDWLVEVEFVAAA